MMLLLHDCGPYIYQSVSAGYPITFNLVCGPELRLQSCTGFNILNRGGVGSGPVRTGGWGARWRGLASGVAGNLFHVLARLGGI